MKARYFTAEEAERILITTNVTFRVSDKEGFNGGSTRSNVA